MQLLKQQRMDIVQQLHRLKQQISALDQRDRQGTGPDSGYCNMMTDEEKAQLISVQRTQMHSANPFVDDFYFMVTPPCVPSLQAYSRRQAHLPPPVDMTLLAPAPAPGAAETTDEPPKAPARPCMWLDAIVTRSDPSGKHPGCRDVHKRVRPARAY